MEEQYTGVAPPYDPTLDHMSFSEIHTVNIGGEEMVKVEVTGNSNNTAILKAAVEANGGVEQRLQAEGVTLPASSVPPGAG